MQIIKQATERAGESSPQANGLQANYNSDMRPNHHQLSPEEEADRQPKFFHQKGYMEDDKQSVKTMTNEPLMRASVPQ